MAFDNRDFDLKAPQHITLENREHLSISGVEEVERFDETTIVLSTTLGELIVRGQDLHIETLSLGGGDLKVEGTVEAFSPVCWAEYGGLCGRPGQGIAGCHRAGHSRWAAL